MKHNNNKQTKATGIKNILVEVRLHDSRGPTDYVIIRKEVNSKK